MKAAKKLCRVSHHVARSIHVSQHQCYIEAEAPVRCTLLQLQGCKTNRPQAIQ